MKRPRDPWWLLRGCLYFGLLPLYAVVLLRIALVVVLRKGAGW